MVVVQAQFFPLFSQFDYIIIKALKSYCSKSNYDHLIVSAYCTFKRPIPYQYRRKKNNMNKILKQRAKKGSGFTLIELLIVMVIIGLLAAFIVPKLIGRVGESKQTSAKAQIELLATAIDVYKLDTGKYPTQDSGLSALITKPDAVKNWKGPYLNKEKIPKDPWGVDFIYKYPGEHGDYDIISYGADENDGGTGEDKDVVSWE